MRIDELLKGAYESLFNPSNTALNRFVAGFLVYV